MRKVLSFVLTVSLILGSFSMAFAANVSDLAGTDYEDAARTLMELEVITGYPDGTFGGEKDVTRAEMATMICKTLGLSEAGYNSFPDAKDHWAKAWIGLAQSLEVITGYPDGTFKPDANVTYYEALAMIIKALGYNDDSLTGTWPNKFIAQAQRLGISDDVTVGAGNAPRGDIASMLFNTLDVTFGTTNKDGVWQANSEGKKIIDMLAKYVIKNHSIDLTDARNATINILDKVGATATVYQNKDGEIIAIGEIKTTFLEGNFNDDGDFESDDVVYTVVPQNTSTTALLNLGTSNSAVMWGNGLAFYGNYSDNSVVIAAEISGKTIRQIHTVNEWIDKTSFQFADSDKTAIGNNKRLGGVDFVQDDNKEIDTNQFILDGVDSLDDIKNDNVVSVYQSGNQIVKIAVGTETVSGKITRVTSGYKVTIDGKEYSASGLKGNAGTISTGEAGKEYDLVLDHNGDYYAFDLISGSSNYALVLQRGDGTPPASNPLSAEDAKVQLLLADGTVSTFPVVDDDFIDSSNAWDATSAAGVTWGAVVKYSLNSSQEIKEITAPTPEVVSTDVSKSGTVNGRTIAADAPIFAIPGGTDSGTNASAAVDKDKAAVKKLDDILDKSVGDATLVYDSSAKRVVAMVIDGDVISDAVYGFATAWGTGADSDYVDMLVDGKEVTHDTDVNLSTLVKTELYKISFDVSNKASFTQITLTSNTNTTTGAIGLYSGTGGTSSPVALTLKGNVLTVDVPTNSAISATSGALAIDVDDYRDIPLDSEVVVYVWDHKNEKFKIGSKSDLAGDVLGVGVMDTDSTPDMVFDIVFIRTK